MTVFIGIHSGSKQIGKTTFCVNSTSAFTQFGKDAVLVDCHFTDPKVGLYLGFSQITRSLQTTIKGLQSVSDVIHYHPSGVQCILCEKQTTDVPSKESLEHVFLSLFQKTEFVLVDTSHDITLANPVLTLCDYTILLTRTDEESVQQTQNSLQTLKDGGIKVLGIVVVRYDEQHTELSLEEVGQRLDSRIIGVIPEDENIVRSQKIRYPLPYMHYDTHATIAYKQFVATIVGQEYVATKSEKESFFSYLLQRLGFTQPK